MITQEKGDGKEFISHAPGYWPEASQEFWNDWKWQLKNRVTSLAQLEKHLELSDEERSGVLLSGDKLALAVTPHFFNLLPQDNPEDPIRRQVIPRIVAPVTAVIAPAAALLAVWANRNCTQISRKRFIISNNTPKSVTCF